MLDESDEKPPVGSSGSPTGEELSQLALRLAVEPLFAFDSVYGLVLLARQGRTTEWGGPESLRDAVGGIFSTEEDRKLLDYEDTFNYVIFSITAWNLTVYRFAELPVGITNRTSFQFGTARGMRLTNDVIALQRRLRKRSELEEWTAPQRSLAVYMYAHHPGSKPGDAKRKADGRIHRALYGPIASLTEEAASLDRAEPTFITDFLSLLAKLSRHNPVPQFAVDRLLPSGIRGPISFLFWEFGYYNLWPTDNGDTGPVARLLRASLPTMMEAFPVDSKPRDWMQGAARVSRDAPRLELSAAEERFFEELVFARWCKRKSPPYSPVEAIIDPLGRYSQFIPLLILRKSSASQRTRQLAELMITQDIARWSQDQKLQEIEASERAGRDASRYRSLILRSVPIVSGVALALGALASVILGPWVLGVGTVSLAAASVWHARRQSRYQGRVSWLFSGAVAIFVQMVAHIPVIVTNKYDPLAWTLTQAATAALVFAGTVRWPGFAVANGVTALIPELNRLPGELRHLIDEQVRQEVEAREDARGHDSGPP
ncbi:hypothetical protein SAMN04515665_1367 [Blastococcus sp. DSM 46786]|uniref:hypothetical protein n=1 Tax=Blastococcus sp. DSM 46786 TaxID=1798227 RepID=UPI0008B1FB47|nr:hypothetical protein [Blastococcus sp. DSM 46786]SEM15417.1 hypothetical protein SAMN04515665_1367 [Blastococcus sp. DSM 46786]